MMKVYDMMIKLSDATGHEIQITRKIFLLSTILSIIILNRHRRLRRRLTLDESVAKRWRFTPKNNIFLKPLCR